MAGDDFKASPAIGFFSCLHLPSGCVDKGEIPMYLLTSRSTAVARNDQRPESAARPAAEPRVPGILIVDDDRTICEMLSQFVQSLGFAVWTAFQGSVAVDLYRLARGRIDLVLLDVRMPEWDGPRTLAELKKLDTKVPCCFMSGDTGRYTPEELMEMGGLRILKKPFLLDEVAQTIREVVAGAEAGARS